MNERRPLIDQLVIDEGLRLKPYTDGRGKLSIGVGRNLTDKGISNREAMILLDTDVDEAVADLSTYPWFASEQPGRQVALTNLRFNLGLAGFKQFKKLIAAMARQDYSTAEVELVDSDWIDQVQRRRSDRIRRQIRTGEI